MRPKTSPPSGDADVPTLRVSPAEAKAKIGERVANGEGLVKAWRENGPRLGNDHCERECTAWDEYNKTLLTSLFGGPLFLEQYRKNKLSMGILDVEADPYAIVKSCVSVVLDKISRLQTISSQVDLCPAPAAVILTEPRTVLSVDRLVRLCRRFPIFARQLQKRHGGRAPFAIADEYDVQDLMHGLLRVEFDDVRPEVWTPNYAGKSSRMDFLIKREQMILEVKMTRDGLGAKELGDQLIIDIQRYKEYPDCGKLICFVFDPEHRVMNPAELEDDLSKVHSNLDVKVVIAPRD